MLSSKCIFKAFLSGSLVLRPRSLHFCRIPNWSNCRYITMIWSNDMTLIWLPFKKNRNFHCYYPNVFLKLLWIEQLQMTVLKWSCDFSKTFNISKMHFYFYRTNVFLKFLWMVYSLWYTLRAVLLNIKLGQLQITVSKKSYDRSNTDKHCQHFW